MEGGAATARSGGRGRSRSIARSLRNYITERIEAHPNIEFVREEVTTIPRRRDHDHRHGAAVLRCPHVEIMKLTGDDQLYFYDAIAPIVAADSIDHSIAFPPRAMIKAATIISIAR